MDINKSKDYLPNQSIWKKIILIFSWTLISPLFFILSSIWKFPKLLWRVLFAIFSPFTLISVFLIIILLQPHGMVICDEPSEYTESVLESKLRIDIPDYVEIGHMKDYRQRTHAELVDFKYNYIKRTKFFKVLKRKVKENPDYWSEDEGNFIYENLDFHLFIHKNQGTGRIGVQLNHPAPINIKI